MTFSRLKCCPLVLLPALSKSLCSTNLHTEVLFTNINNVPHEVHSQENPWQFLAFPPNNVRNHYYLPSFFGQTLPLGHKKFPLICTVFISEILRGGDTCPPFPLNEFVWVHFGHPSSLFASNCNPWHLWCKKRRSLLDHICLQEPQIKSLCWNKMAIERVYRWSWTTSWGLC